MENKDLPAIKNLDMELIKACSSARQALSLCIRASGFADETVADELGISKGYLSKVLSGRASLDGDRRIKLMQICGNRAPLQYEAWAMGLSTTDRDPSDMLREAIELLARRNG